MNHLNVLYTSNNNYAQHSGVSICSLLENNRHIDNITIYYVYDNLTDDNLEKLKRQVHDYGENREIRFINGQEHIDKMKQMGVHGYRSSHAPNLRLFFDEYIDNSVERLLYLDSDTIVLGSLFPLLQLDFQDKCAAVICDSIGSNYKRYIGFQEDQPYFNSGVILFHVDNWFKNNCKQSLLKYMNTPGMMHTSPDQDYLNLVLKDKLYILPPEYNLQPFHLVYKDSIYFSNYSKIYYSGKQLDDARAKPVIVHTFRFLGQFPWHKNNLHPSKALYKKYLGLSEWAGSDEETNSKFIFSLERIIYRILPRRVFLKVFVTLQGIYFHYKERMTQKPVQEEYNKK